MECNKQPNFDEVNDAIARRLDVIPFVSSFYEKHRYDDAVKSGIDMKNIHLADTYFKSEEFKNDNRQALIEMLFTYFEKFRKNGYKFVDIPEECKEASNKYRKKSDNIYNWFSENYSEDKNSVVMIKNAYSMFKESELYINMTKQEKRANNLHNFTEEIKENMFIGKHFKDRDTTYNKIKYKSAYIVGFLTEPVCFDISDLFKTVFFVAFSPFLVVFLNMFFVVFLPFLHGTFLGFISHLGLYIRRIYFYVVFCYFLLKLFLIYLPF